MVIHMFALRWKDAATPEDQRRALSQIRAFQGVIPGLLETVAGTNTSSRGQGYTFCAMMRFTDQAALDSYQGSTPHLELLQWMVPLVDAIDLDLQA